MILSSESLGAKAAILTVQGQIERKVDPGLTRPRRHPFGVMRPPRGSLSVAPQPGSRREVAMSKPILVGYDPRQADNAPVELGAAAARFTGAPLLVVTVDAGHHRRHDHRTGHIDEDLPGDVGEACGRVEARLKEAGLTCECRSVQSTSAARGLHEA